MGDGKTILEINALGTHYVDQEFKKVMKEGTVILNVSSMSAYMLPNLLISAKKYPLIFKDEEKFVNKSLKKSRMFSKKWKQV